MIIVSAAWHWESPKGKLTSDCRLACAIGYPTAVARVPKTAILAPMTVAMTAAMTHRYDA
jgi:hypothetical protein